ARQMENISVRLYLQAPAAETAWGTANGVKCSIMLAPPRSNQWSRAEISFRAVDATTRWAATTNLSLTMHLYSTREDTNVVHAEMELTADTAKSQSNRAENVQFVAQWFHSLTNAMPLSGEGELRG